MTVTGHATDLVGTVGSLASARPHETAATFVDYSTDRAGAAEQLSYAQLDTRARMLACRLQRDLGPGSRVAVLCPQGLDYVVGFLACLYAGMIAVPLYAPEMSRRNDRVLLAMRDCGCAAVLTVGRCRGAVTEMLSGAHRILCVDEDSDTAVAWAPPVVDPAATAYLQYTSGSTREPAGVRVTHGNVVAAAAQLAHAARFDEHAHLVSWLPLFHDMGLVSGILTPLFSHARITMMSPLAFVQRPSRWLGLLTEHRATHTLSPNFGLDLCVDRVPEQQRAGLDLSSLIYLGNGAEPVRPSTMARFTAAFGPHGFRHSAHTAGYGLAETTLVVTSADVDEEPAVLGFDRDELAAGRVRELAADDPRAHPMVSCGAPVRQEVAIVDSGTRGPSGTVGEIWVRGANTCAGYWTDSARSREVFGATLDGEPGWVRTGDLGFRHEGALFIAGRVKDLVIVDGRNLYPVDIEGAVADACPALRRGHVVAFAVDTRRGESVVVVAEPASREPVDLAALRRDVRAVVGDRFDADVHDVVLIRRGTLPKTSSGKPRRGHCRELYQQGRLTGLGVA